MTARTGLTLVEVILVVVVVAVLLGLLFPAARSAREAARRNSCVCHGKGITLAVHNHHDVFKRLPNSTTTRIHGVRPGCTGPGDGKKSAGFGWQVKILPYLDEINLYNSISEASDKFSKDAFDPSLIAKADAAGGAVRHLANTSFGFFRCPSYSGPVLSDALEYRNVGGVETSTYVALSATDLPRAMSADDADEADLSNGVLVPPPQLVNFREIKDGSSKTFLFAETRERRYASWYDGTVNWCVGADPNSAAPERNVDGFLVARAPTAINVGPIPQPSTNYLPSQLTGTRDDDWHWGPSSEHSGGVTTHGIADGSVRCLTEDIDPTLYLQLITRADREQVNLPE